jgi:hypothetical protein
MQSNIIFIVSYGRSGSTLLCQLLTLYQNTINLNEALTVPDAYLSYTDNQKSFENFLTTKNINNINAEDFHKQLLKDPIGLITDVSNYFSETIIAKIHLNNFDLIEEKFWQWLLTQPNHKFILLERKNYLDTYISEKISGQISFWHNIDTTSYKVKVDTDDFYRNLKIHDDRYDSIKKYFNRYNVEYLEVAYEKDLKTYNIEDLVSLISPWSERNGLNLQPGSLPKVKVRKQNNNNDIFDNIINAEEVKEFLVSIENNKE